MERSSSQSCFSPGQFNLSDLMLYDVWIHGGYADLCTFFWMVGYCDHVLKPGAPPVQINPMAWLRAQL
jgi:hypothetical protein